MSIYSYTRNLALKEPHHFGFKIEFNVHIFMCGERKKGTDTIDSNANFFAFVRFFSGSIITQHCAIVRHTQLNQSIGKQLKCQVYCSQNFFLNTIIAAHP